MQTAICPMIRALARGDRLAPPVGDWSFKAEATLTRAPCQAGAKPKIIPVRIETRPVKRKTQISRRISGRRGRLGGLRRSRTGTDHIVTSKPSAPPEKPRKKHQVHDRRPTRTPEAPLDAATVIPQ